MTAKPPAKRAPIKKAKPKVEHPTVIDGDVLDPTTLDTWSRLKYEAAQLRADDPNGDETPRQFTPFIIDVVDPPIVIQSPTTAIQQVVISNLVDIKGAVKLQDVHDLLEAVVGDETEFARLKSLMISQRFDEYMIGGLIKLIRDHFQAQVGKGSDAVPGKSPA